MVRVLVADDHEMVRAGIRRLCESTSDFEVVAETSDGQRAIDIAVETQPEIAIIDFSLPHKNGAEVTRSIRAGSAHTRILIYSMHDNDTVIEEVLRSGAQGYLVKGSPGSILLEAMTALADHRSYFSENVEAKLIDKLAHDQLDPCNCLSNRERSVVQLIAEGYSSKRIARLLEITVKTVESHRTAIMKKLEARTTADLVRYAIRNYLIEP